MNTPRTTVGKSLLQECDRNEALVIASMALQVVLVKTHNVASHSLRDALEAILYEQARVDIARRLPYSMDTSSREETA